MKVAQVLESSATGTPSMVCTIANRLAQEGHDVHVIYSMRAQTPVELVSNVVVVRHRRTGVVYKNADDALNMLTWLFDDGASRKSIAARASDEAHHGFGEDRFFKQLAAIYAS
jgi:hypothetical protein